MTTEPKLFVDGDAAPLMQCGHTAQGTMDTPGGKIWACIIDAGLTAKALLPAETPNLEGRLALCGYTRMRNGHQHPLDKIVASSTALAFFEHRPNQEFDQYYCGCWGWD